MANDQTIPVLLPLALEAPYDYLAPGDEVLGPGDFVAVPLATRERVGVVWEGALVDARGQVEASKLRPVIGRLDMPRLPPVSLAFAEWVARYTLSPPGMVLRMMMSARAAFEPPKPSFGVRREGPPPERMTAARGRVLEVMENGLLWNKAALAEAAGVSPSVINGLVDAGTLSVEVMPEAPLPEPDPDFAVPELSADQDAAATTLREAVAQQAYTVSLLDGVTGSGKTEVYFRGGRGSVAHGQAGLDPAPGNRPDEPVHRPIRGALRGPSRRVALGDDAGAPGADLARRRHRRGAGRCRRALGPVSPLPAARADRRGRRA